MKESEYEKIKISCEENAGKISSNSNFTCWGYFKLNGEIYTFKTKKNRMDIDLVNKEFLTDKTDKKTSEIPAINCKAVSPDDDFDVHQEDGPVIIWGAK